MIERRAQRMCVFLPCAAGLSWAVPQNCLAEIVTVPATDNVVPPAITWRRECVPVMDFGEDGEIPWAADRSSTGLVAVFLGIEGTGCEYWGLALRGGGLGVHRVDESECRDRPEAQAEHALAAFEYDGRVYQVPDLPALQRLARELETAVSA